MVSLLVVGRVFTVCGMVALSSRRIGAGGPPALLYQGCPPTLPQARCILRPPEDRLRSHGHHAVEAYRMSSLTDVLAGLRGVCEWQERVHTDLDADPAVVVAAASPRGANA